MRAKFHAHTDYVGNEFEYMQTIRSMRIIPFGTATVCPSLLASWTLRCVLRLYLLCVISNDNV